MDELYYPFFTTRKRDTYLILNVRNLDSIRVGCATFKKWRSGDSNEKIEQFLNKRRPAKHAKVPTKGRLRLILNQNCNLACRYCYETCCKRKTVIGIKEISDHLKTNKYYSVGLFGGEPLLYFDLFKQAVEIVHSAGIKRISVITNGTLISDEIAEFIADSKIDPAVSIDGRKSVHDAMRVDKAGRGTYERTFEGIKKLQNNGSDVIASLTISKLNAKTIAKEIEHLAGLGIKKFSFSLFMGADEGLYPNVLANAYDKILEMGLRELNLNELIDVLYRKIPHIRGCSAGAGYQVLSPMGLFGCHAFATAQIQSPSLQEFRDRTIDKIDACSKCYAAPFCGGGCAYTAYVNNHNILSPGGNCSARKRVMDWAVKRFYL
jgi:uncharacterized protein